MIQPSVGICCLALRKKSEEMILSRAPRSCKRLSDIKVNTSIHSNVRRKSSTRKKSLSQHTCKESYNECQINKKSQKVPLTSTPAIPRQVKSSTVKNKNIPDKKSGRQKRSRNKLDLLPQVILFKLQDEEIQSKFCRNLRSRCSTQLEENSDNLKENRMSGRELRSCRKLANDSNSVSSKKGRKALKCKKNTMKQDKYEQNLEKSCFQNDVFARTPLRMPVTSTPLVSHKRKSKTFENLNTPAHQTFAKSTSTKKKTQSSNDFSFEMHNKTAGSLQSSSVQTRTSKKTYSNLKKQIKKNAKCTQKSSNKGKSVIQLNKGHTFNDFPVDDLSLSKTVLNKRKVKSEGFKAPSKNTLKRKRHVFNEFHKANDGYEDDIYESQKFDCFKELLQDASFSDVPSSMPTPKFGMAITPRILPKSPVFRDCISPTEYARSRKIAEECYYRRKKKKNVSQTEIAAPEKKKLEFNQVLESIQMQEKIIENLMQKEGSDKEDSSLSD